MAFKRRLEPNYGLVHCRKGQFPCPPTCRTRGAGQELGEHKPMPQHPDSPWEKGLQLLLETLSLGDSLPSLLGQFQYHSYSNLAADQQTLFPLTSTDFFSSSPSVLRVAKCHHFMSFFFFLLKHCMWWKAGVLRTSLLPSLAGHLFQRALPGMQLCPLSMYKVIFSTPPAKIV